MHWPAKVPTALGVWHRLGFIYFATHKVHLKIFSGTQTHLTMFTVLIPASWEMKWCELTAHSLMIQEAALSASSKPVPWSGFRVQLRTGRAFHGIWYKVGTTVTEGYSRFHRSSPMSKPNYYSGNYMVIQDPWIPLLDTPLLISCLRVLVLVSAMTNCHWLWGWRVLTAEWSSRDSFSQPRCWVPGHSCLPCETSLVSMEPFAIQRSAKCHH